MMKGAVRNIPLALVDEGERFRQHYEKIDELANSIKTHGLIQPIAVMENGERFLLLAGGRRFQALKSLELVDTNVTVYPACDELTQREIELIENLQREEMHYAEEAKLRQRIHDLEIEKHGPKLAGYTEGASLESTASLLGIGRHQLSRDIELAEAIERDPDLAQKKNKAEAHRALEKQKEDVLHRALAERTLDRLENLEDEKQRLINGYVVGDTFELIKELPDNQFHLIELDPPYGVDLSEINKNSEHLHDDYNEVDSDEYQAFMHNILHESYRVLKPGGWLICWFGSRWYSMIAKALEVNGFRYHAVPAIWNKPEPGATRSPLVNLGIQYEPFFYARKGNAVIERPGRGNVFTHAAAKDRFHPAERPISLIMDILATFTAPASRILSPFLGSGNTLLAASNLGMQAMGYDMSSNYKNHYINRVTLAKPGEYK